MIQPTIDRKVWLWTVGTVKPASHVTDEMVSRFLSWMVPQDFAPDAGISFNPREGQLMPTGTNLLHAGQARAMLEHVLGALPDQAVIHLTPHEVQSGSTRVDWAEGLIRQLPETHDGRNSWLLNYGTAPDARPKPAPEPATTGETEQDKQTAHQFETKTYPDGTTATGLGPLPDASPADPIEAEIKAKGLTAPRVTPKDIEAAIASEHYFTAIDGAVGAARAWHGANSEVEQAAMRIIPLHLLTFCVLVLRNGFTVTGESACASAENFDFDLGQKIARKNAIDKVWPLLGYALRERLAVA